MSITTNKNKPPYISIALLSAVGLAYEVLLLRLFSVVQWHHFAYMIVSFALLGYGASGTFLSIFQQWSQRNYRRLFLSCIFLFAISSWCCSIAGQYLPFNALELFWDSYQWIWLFLLYLLFVVPFFCVATCIALSFSYNKLRINFSYAADLGGAAVGAIGIVFLLNYLFPAQALHTLVSISMLAAVVAMVELNINRRWLIAIMVIAIIPWITPSQWSNLRSSEYKPLNQTLKILGSEVVKQSSSPLGLITAVENQQIPFRHAPGLSLNTKQPPPAQIALFTDGDGMTVINQFDGNIDSLHFLNQTTSALPYQLLQQPNALIVGAGGGSEVLQALSNNAATVDAVEINEQIYDLVAEDFAQFSGDIYKHEKVKIHIAEARAYLSANKKKYDLIQISLMGSFGAATAGLASLGEDYLYTIDAFGAYLEQLHANGILAITRWLKIPPRDTLKLVATAITTLHDKGITQAENHLVAIRSWNTVTLLIKNNPLSEEEIKRVRQFSEQNSFDVIYYPGIAPSEVNQYNKLGEPQFYNGIKTLLSNQHEQFISQYKYDISPSSDDKPFFFHFLKLSSLPEILRLPANQGLALIDWGTVVLLITLLQASVASLVLIVLPLWLFYRTTPQARLSGTNQFVLLYFFLIGIAFMFIEMAFIQKFVLFLGQPIYAFAVVICAFLCFAGIGSAVSKNIGRRRKGLIPFIGIVTCALIYLPLLPSVFDSLNSSSEIAKICISFILISPMAFFMGMPFPLAMARLAEKAPQHIPWAWGINGCASVISAVLATLLAIQFGFTVVIVTALCLYLYAFLLLKRQVK